jgi:uncharacterized protein (UPF0264 family)
MTARGRRPPLPRGLLVSVRSVAEARAAVLGGAAIVDVKEPLTGPLGPAEPAVAAEIAAAIGDETVWTLACGEWREGVDVIRQHLDTLSGLLGDRVPPPAAIKAGLAGLANQPWRHLLTEFAAAPWATVAVAYADWDRAESPDPAEVIDAAAAAGCDAVLVDTFDKSGPSLLAARSAASIADWVQRAHAAGMQIALAGRIAAGDLSAVCDFVPDIVGLRSAVCAGGRLGTVDEKLVRQADRLLRYGLEAQRQPVNTGERT